MVADWATKLLEETKGKPAKAEQKKGE